jgi:hypothetical protein
MSSSRAVFEVIGGFIGRGSTPVPDSDHIRHFRSPNAEFRTPVNDLVTTLCLPYGVGKGDCAFAAIPADHLVDAGSTHPFFPAATSRPIDRPRGWEEAINRTPPSSGAVLCAGCSTGLRRPAGLRVSG